MAAPIARKVAKQAINTGTAILKPHAQKIGRQALAVGTQIASDKVGEISNRIQTNLNRAGNRKLPKKRGPSKLPSKFNRKAKKQKDLFDQ